MSHHQPEEIRKGQKETPRVLPPPSRRYPSWLSNACPTRKDPESEWLTKDNRGTNSITIKPETASHMAEQFSWVPTPSCSLPGLPLPNKVSCFVSTCVSSDNLCQNIRQEPTLRPWKRSPFLQHLNAKSVSWRISLLTQELASDTLREPARGMFQHVLACSRAFPWICAFPSTDF